MLALLDFSIKKSLIYITHIILTYVFYWMYVVSIFACQILIQSIFPFNIPSYDLQNVYMVLHCSDQS